MVTMRDVAKKAGVSSATVSHVINGTRYVSDSVREKVLMAMDETGYRPNVLARSLRMGKTNTIGLILPDSSNPFFAEIGQAIEGAAFEQSFNIILCNTDNDIEKEYLYLDILSKKQVDGIIFVATGDSPNSLHLLEKHRMPFVLVDREVKDFSSNTVVTDNYQGGLIATEHAIELGHTNIAFITGPSNVTPSAQRKLGYYDALKNNGIQYRDELSYKGDFHPESGRLAAHHFLGTKNPPTAIIASNDLEAIGVIRGVYECGKRVPEDITVIGFDNIELSSYVTPRLTTIDQPKIKIAESAMKLLINTISKDGEDSPKVCLKTSLVIRESSGVCK